MTRPLGRVVDHDPRSLQYLVPETTTTVTVKWKRDTPVLDQGELGSCTGNAAAGCLGTDPYFSTLPGVDLTENTAVALYSAAEKIDGGQGYPPEDQGSSGLSVAKAAKNAGYITGYTHITSISAAHTAIQCGPFIVGSNWYDGFDTPNAAGVVSISGSVRGGHEYECIGYDTQSGLWEFVNSWGTSYGVAGHFFYSTATFTRLLSEQGDATVFTPLGAPAPVPVPPPLPAPGTAADTALAQAAHPWVTEHHTGGNHVMQLALEAWLDAKGL